jgi:hypothetical protein
MRCKRRLVQPVLAERAERAIEAVFGTPAKPRAASVAKPKGQKCVKRLLCYTSTNVHTDPHACVRACVCVRVCVCV